MNELINYYLHIIVIFTLLILSFKFTGIVRSNNASAVAISDMNCNSNFRYRFPI